MKSNIIRNEELGIRNCGKRVTAVAEYSAELTASVEKGNVFGCQFHPEKSGDVGLKILKAFCEL